MRSIEEIREHELILFSMMEQLLNFEPNNFEAISGIQNQLMAIQWVLGERELIVKEDPTGQECIIKPIKPF